MLDDLGYFEPPTPHTVLGTAITHIEEPLTNLKSSEAPSDSKQTKPITKLLPNQIILEKN
jgi:hypothetical protein